ncbi:hypothetical protein [uncultured Piscinibacter sp.]|uniref:hypothetical protein n=1 Tax=uncultured Piscinibacter sp. TaxID=1131835 RepID=UPI0026250A27|nr:hypothetical protein [uncultured Piscinibacter sp.]
MSKRILIVMTLAAGLVACGEKPQTAGSKKADGKSWDAAQNAFVAEGWKSGDQASWETQMKTRAQGQNEYSRASAQK